MHRTRIEYIKDFLQTYKSVLTDADVEETGMDIDGQGAPQLKYFQQLVCLSGGTGEQHD